MGTKLLTDLVISMLVGALDVIQRLVDSTDFKEILDKILNSVESNFAEDSTLDLAAETICARIRKRFDVEDSDPNN